MDGDGRMGVKIPPLKSVRFRDTFGNVTIEVVDESTTDLVSEREKLRDHYLGELRDAVRYGELVDSMKLVAVKGARDQGATWEQLGEVLGISHQGARSTWQKRLKALPQESAV